METSVCMMPFHNQDRIQRTKYVSYTETQKAFCYSDRTD